MGAHHHPAPEPRRAERVLRIAPREVARRRSEDRVAQASNSRPSRRHIWPWDRDEVSMIVRPWSPPLPPRRRSSDGAAFRVPSRDLGIRGTTSRCRQAVGIVYRPMSRNWSLTTTLSGRARRFSSANAASKLSRRESRSPKLRRRTRRRATRPKVSAGRWRRRSAAGDAYAERGHPLGSPKPSSAGCNAELGRHLLWRAPASSRRCNTGACLLYTSPSPRDATLSRMPSSA